jgi:hypothetical protein
VKFLLNRFIEWKYMSETLEIIDQEVSKYRLPAHTRKQLIGSAAAAVGGMGLIAAVPGSALAATGINTPQTILDVAATAEVLATIVNTVGPEKVSLDAVTKANINAAAREELIHYNVLTSVGGKTLTKTIWVPDAVFASKSNLLNTLVAGDQIFVNAYLIGTTAYANAGKGEYARITAEIMGVEAVHRALALQSLGELGNDRVFSLYAFHNVLEAVAELEKAGFGFGKKGKGPGQFYDFDSVKSRTPNPSGVDSRTPA